MCKKLFKYCSETNHPWIQIFYIFIGPISYLGFIKCFLINRWSYINIPISIISFICFILGMYNYYKSCKVNPGIINEDNIKYHLNELEDNFDKFTFVKGNICKTCNFEKLI